MLLLCYPVNVASRVRLKPLEGVLGVRWVSARGISKPLSLRYGLSEFIQNANLVVAFFVCVRIAPLSLSRSSRQLNLSGGVDTKKKNRSYPQLFVLFFLKPCRLRASRRVWKKDTADAARP